jgi:hypothetical protein
LSRIGTYLLAFAVLAYLIWWGLHIVGCLTRRDFRMTDKIFWFAVLAIPIIGLVLYRGLAPEFYKAQPRRIAPGRVVAGRPENPGAEAAPPPEDAAASEQ